MLPATMAGVVANGLVADVETIWLDRDTTTGWCEQLRELSDAPVAPLRSAGRWSDA
jgi:hypothetical protein